MTKQAENNAANTADNRALNNLLYSPQLVYSWKSLNVDNFGVKLPITTCSGMGQYWTPVFETEEECRREYPDCEIVILKR